jgi:hypothetical protein
MRFNQPAYYHNLSPQLGFTSDPAFGCTLRKKVNLTEAREAKKLPRSV